MFTVKEIAGRMGVSEHTIRFYTDRELIPGVIRDKNNNRLFDEDAVNWLMAIRCLKDSGMSLDAIKEYVDLCLEGDSTIEVRYQIILRQRELARIQVEEAKNRLAYMDQKVENYRRTMEQHMPDTMNPAKWPAKEAK